jgi:hypothetical protein
MHLCDQVEVSLEIVALALSIVVMYEVKPRRVRPTMTVQSIRLQA